MKILQIIFISIFYLFFLALPSLAVTPPCAPGDKRVECVFGTISPPPAIKALAGDDQTGAAGISQFFTNLVGLFSTVAAIALIFMLLWGAFEWMTSGGDKEKLAAAQRRILNAIIGIVLFAITFPILLVLGQFTGFDFFKGQKELIQKLQQQQRNRENERRLEGDPG